MLKAVDDQNPFERPIFLCWSEFYSSRRVLPARLPSTMLVFDTNPNNMNRFHWLILANHASVRFQFHANVLLEWHKFRQWSLSDNHFSRQK